MVDEEYALKHHIREVLKGTRHFENVFQCLIRMILETSPKKIIDCGATKTEYPIFRQGKKHIVNLYDELNSLVHYIKDAAEGGTSKEMAYVLISEPGTGKTFLIEYLCRLYRDFLRREKNCKYTFRFKNLDKLKSYGRISFIESQTYEDPMILAMNLFYDKNANKEFLRKEFNINDKIIEQWYENHRFLGADTGYILNDIRMLTNGDVNEIMDFIEIVPVIITENSGVITGKYAAKDKITSSSVDLTGREDLRRLLYMEDANNPYRFDLRRGALARVAGGGIHFADELYKNKKDLIQIYLGVIQDRFIEIDGFRWPLDTFIIGTSNNEEFNKFRNEEGEAPIISRCSTRYVSHVTNYKSQQEITAYAISDTPRKTINGKDLHQDPNLNYTLSVVFALSRLPHNEKLTKIETFKLAAGEVAGDKSAKALREVTEELNKNPDVTKRFGQKGLGYRDLGRAIQLLNESFETNEGECMFAYDGFKCVERVILDYVNDANDRNKYFEDVKEAKKLYRKYINTALYNAYRDDPKAIEKDVMNYINMIVGITDNLGADKIWRYKDPQTKEYKEIKIDERYINSVEERLNHKNKEEKEAFRSSMRNIYGHKMVTNPNYNFMDNLGLVQAVTEVRIKSDIAGAGSLVGALANRTNEENKILYDRMIKTMMEKMGYCKTCGEKTIEYFCNKDDES